ncbi:winged helix-turn-helix domain-containing protein [Novosphingobium sp.]|uniref:ArsR/SmtB family transcription factor n=1 Tax=Novosphingobium sp. TaxID=1874826 RepID=UPI0025F6A49B|nr:winged helix-turn-helix domain-containing protein [Novosphingobium sp.]
MFEGPDIAEVAALMGDPARARMLSALMDGRAWTPSELAAMAGVGASTASAHLTRLRAGSLISEVKQGRHRYVRLAGPDVAQAIEALQVLSAHAAPKRRPGPRDEQLRFARTCYGHLAGTAGVRLFAYLTELDSIAASARGWVMTANGAAWASTHLGISVAAGQHHGRSCLDWSERCEHLGGELGRTLLGAMAKAGLVSIGNARNVTPLSAGIALLPEVFSSTGD